MCWRHRFCLPTVGLILEQTAALRLPAIYQWPETVEEGGLAAYGPRIVQLFRDVLARKLVKLLRGTDLADLPSNSRQIRIGDQPPGREGSGSDDPAVKSGST